MSRNISCPNFRVLAYQMAEKSQFPFFIKKFLFKIENPTSRAPSKPKTYRGVSARGAFDREFDGLSFVEIAKWLGSLLRRTGQFKWINNFMHSSGGQLPFFLEASRLIRTTGHPPHRMRKVPRYNRFSDDFLLRRTPEAVHRSLCRWLRSAWSKTRKMRFWGT